MLEEQEEGEIKALINEVVERIVQWVKEVNPWSPNNLDNERLMWLRCYSIPGHGWSPNFFTFLTCSVGVYVCSDNEIRLQMKTHMARILVRT